MDKNKPESTDFLEKLPVLKVRHQLFSDEFLKSGNPTQSAIVAGYSPKSARNQGSRMMQNEDVKKYIKLSQGYAALNSQLSSEWILDRLMYVVKECLKPGRTFNPGAANKALELLGKNQGTFEQDAKKNEERPAFIGISINMGGKDTGVKMIEAGDEIEPGTPEPIN